MDKEINFITFVSIRIEKRKCHHRKNLILFEYLDIVNITISSKVSSGENHYIYFIGYKDNDYEIKISGIMLPKTSTYVKSYDGETKCMIFLIRDYNLMKKHNDV